MLEVVTSIQSIIRRIERVRFSECRSKAVHAMSSAPYRRIEWWKINPGQRRVALK